MYLNHTDNTYTNVSGAATTNITNATARSTHRVRIEGLAEHDGRAFAAAATGDDLEAVDPGRVIGSIGQ